MTILTTNIAPKLFLIHHQNNQWKNDFIHSPFFLSYSIVFGLSIVVFCFSFLLHLIQDYMRHKETTIYSTQNLKWFFIAVLFFPLVPFFFSLLFLLVSIFFNLLGFNQHTDTLNNQTLSDVQMNFLQFQKTILPIWNNVNLNKTLNQVLTQKNNTNNFYFDNLVAQIHAYLTFMNQDQNVLNSINQALYHIKMTQNNQNWQNLLSQDITTLNNFNNHVINIQQDLNNLNLSNLNVLKQNVKLYSTYFSGQLIKTFLLSNSNSLCNFLPTLGFQYHLNLIGALEEITGNNSNIITWQPNFYQLNWNVLIALVLGLILLVVMFLFALVEIRRIMEIIIIFLLTPILLVINGDENGYFFQKWLKLTLRKFSSLLIIAFIFQTCLITMPYLAHAVCSSISQSQNAQLICYVIVCLGCLIASFFSINTILWLFDSKEDFMELLGDLFAINSAVKTVPILGKLFHKKTHRNAPNKHQANNESYNEETNEPNISYEDMVWERFLQPSQGIDTFMTSAKTQHYLNETVNKANTFLFYPWNKKISETQNKWINNTLNKNFQKYEMVEQKWKKNKRVDGTF